MTDKICAEVALVSKKVYEKPEINYWFAAELDAIETRMSGGGSNPIYWINLSTYSIEIESNEYFILEATNSWGTILKSPDITWESYDESIVVVDQGGKLTPKGLGTTKVKVRYTNKNSISGAECSVTISKSNADRITFAKYLISQMGFKSKEAKDIAMMYRLLRKKYSAIIAANKFFQIVASSSYGSGLIGTAFSFLGDFTIDDSRKELKKIGYASVSIENIFSIISKQHDACNDPDKKEVDFAHMAATMSTILCQNFTDYLGFAAGFFNGIQVVDDHAGYIGDVCGTFYATPAIDNSDYKSDLDAVNLSIRIQASSKTLFKIMNEYYSGLDNKSRAEEFVENVTWEVLNDQYETYKDYLKKQAIYIGLSGTQINEYVDLCIKTFDLFIANLQNGNNEWDETL